MDNQRFVGILLRFLRLQRNWSQETLCHGICAVSYLSKIEQGKVDANPQLLRELFSRLDVTWQKSAESESLREELYEGIFSRDRTYTQQMMTILEENWDRLAMGPCYGDFMVIRAYCHGKPEWVLKDLERILDSRQRALLAIIRDSYEEAYQIYPCALTAFCVGEEAYLNLRSAVKRWKRQRRLLGHWTARCRWMQCRYRSRCVTLCAIVWKILNTFMIRTTEIC